MPIDGRTVQEIAALARLQVAPEEEARYVKELQEILAYVEQLQGIDISGIEPTNTVIAGEPPALRMDEERSCEIREDALREAPDREGDYFRVPRVV